MSVSRYDSGELLIVATTLAPKTAVAIYLRRWEIENLFQCLKGRGFRFEETHVTQLDRIDRLMTLLTIGICWAHKTGEWRASKKPIRFNRHHDSRRPQNSYFRYGYDYIRGLLVQSTRQAKQQMNRCVTLLSLPDTAHLEGAT